MDIFLAEEEITAGALTLYPQRYEVHVAGKVVELTRQDLRLLRLFLRHPNETLSRRQIGLYIWADENVPHSRVNETIRRMRYKLEDNPHAPRYIMGFKTKPTGYRLTI